MSTPTAFFGAAKCDIVLHPSDMTLAVDWTDWPDMSGVWTLTVRQRVTSEDAILTRTLAVDDERTSASFTLAELIALVPHSDSGLDGAYVARSWVGAYAIAQGDAVRLVGALTIDLTAQRP